MIPTGGLVSGLPFDLVRNVYFVLFDFPFRKPRRGKETKTIAKWSVVLGSLTHSPTFSRSPYPYPKAPSPAQSPLFTHFVTPVIEGCLGRRPKPISISSHPIVWVGSLKRAPPRSYVSQTQDTRPQSRFSGWVIPRTHRWMRWELDGDGGFWAESAHALIPQPKTRPI